MRLYAGQGKSECGSYLLKAMNLELAKASGGFNPVDDLLDALADVQARCVAGGAPVDCPGTPNPFPNSELKQVLLRQINHTGQKNDLLILSGPRRNSSICLLLEANMGGTRPVLHERILVCSTY